MTQPEIATGQQWRPAADSALGGGLIRIVCRYPFEIPGHDKHAGPVWIIEFLESVHRLERIPEATLREFWQLETDVQDKP